MNSTRPADGTRRTPGKGRPAGMLTAVAILLALLTQCGIAAITEDPWDLQVWRDVGRGMEDNSLYSASSEYPYAYPPLWGWWCHIAYRVNSALAAPPWLDRLVLKLPILLGNLLLAWLLARRLSQRSDRPAISPSLLLWNPLLLLAGTAYGMFDVWITLTLSFSLLALAEGRLKSAAALWAVSSNLKGFFPAFLLPLLVAHVWRTRGRGRALAFTGFAVGLALLPSAWYLATEPGNFLRAVGHHSGDTLNGLSTWAVIEQTLVLPRPNRLAMNLVMAAAILAGLGAAILFDRRSRGDASDRLLLSAVIATLFLFIASRVVNEQYYIWILGPLFLVSTRSWQIRRYLQFAIWIPSIHLLLHFGPDLIHPLIGPGDFHTGRYVNLYPTLGVMALGMSVVNVVFLFRLLRPRRHG